MAGVARVLCKCDCKLWLKLGIALKGYEAWELFCFDTMLQINSEKHQPAMI